MRKTTRTLTAGLLSLPLALGVSGVAMADTATEGDVRISAEVSSQQSEGFDRQNDGILGGLLGDDQFEQGEDRQNEGILEELLGGLLGDDQFEQGEDHQNEYHNDGVLGGIL